MYVCCTCITHVIFSHAHTDTRQAVSHSDNTATMNHRCTSDCVSLAVFRTWKNDAWRLLRCKHVIIPFVRVRILRLSNLAARLGSPAGARHGRRFVLELARLRRHAWRPTGRKKPVPDRNY